MHVTTNNTNLRKIVWPCILALVLSSGCATTIKTNVLMPGKIDQAAQFKNIAVMPIGVTVGSIARTV